MHICCHQITIESPGNSAAPSMNIPTFNPTIVGDTRLAWATLVVFNTQLNPRRLGCKAAIQDISEWVECYSKMAAVLSARYPEKAPELWAYLASIVRAARNFEGSLWIGYDRQYRGVYTMTLLRAGQRLYPDADIV